MSSSKWKLHILGSTLITSMIATTVNNLTGLTYKSLKMEKSKKKFMAGMGIEPVTSGVSFTYISLR